MVLLMTVMFLLIMETFYKFLLVFRFYTDQIYPIPNAHSPTKQANEHPFTGQ